MTSLQTVPANESWASATNGTWTTNNSHSALKLGIPDPWRGGQFPDGRKLRSCVQNNIPIYGHVVPLSALTLSYTGFDGAFGGLLCGSAVLDAVPLHIIMVSMALNNGLRATRTLGTMRETGPGWTSWSIGRTGLPEYVVYHHHGIQNPALSCALANVESATGRRLLILRKACMSFGRARRWTWFQHSCSDILIAIANGSTMSSAFLTPKLKEESRHRHRPHQGTGLQYRPTLSSIWEKPEDRCPSHPGSQARL